MAKNSWTEQLKRYDDAVKDDYNPFLPENMVRCTSPYVNWIFGHRNGAFPKGCGVMLYGPQKSGKSLLISDFIANLHREDPEAIVIKFNTELRGQYQKSTFLGIDPDRLIEYDTNVPIDIFNRISGDISEMIDQGAPIKMIVIDSMSGIRGIRGLDSNDIDQAQIGDEALTITRGLKQIASILKKKKIAYFLTSHMRANIDTNNPHAKKDKAAANWATKHFAEYFVSVVRAGAKDDVKDLAGNLFESEIKDARGNKDVIAHSIYCKMEESSFGISGRAAKFTIDYKNGIINIHDQITEMAMNAGIIKSAGGSWYEYDGKRMNGKKQVSLFLKDNPELAQELVKQVHALDN
jgi:recombination protein RecA